MNRKKILVGFIPPYAPNQEMRFVAAYLAHYRSQTVGIPLTDLVPEPAVGRDEDLPWLALAGLRRTFPEAPFALHTQRLTTAETFYNESRFADLAILTRSVYDELRQAIGNNIAECSLVVLPQGVAHIHNILLFYDGTEQSLSVIRQFVQLVPDLCLAHDATLLCDEAAAPPRADEVALISYLKLHFRSLGWHKITNATAQQLASALDFNQHSLVVTASPPAGLLGDLYRQALGKEGATPLTFVSPANPSHRASPAA